MFLITNIEYQPTLFSSGIFDAFYNVLKFNKEIETMKMH